MDRSGPLLIAFGLCLLLSPIAIKTYDAWRTGQLAGDELVTEGASDAACASKSIQTAFGKLGCSRQTSRAEVRHTAPSGAVFVKARS